MKKTVLELDLVGYSKVASILEQNGDSRAVAGLNEQIQSFIDQGLCAIKALRISTVMSKTGDGAILVFDKAAAAHRFADAVHKATRKHNRGKTERSAIRLFRMGAATGDITMERRGSDAYDIAGVTIARAVRLEAAALPGELLIDSETYDDLPRSHRALYGHEERIIVKDEEFWVRRCAMNPDAPKEARPNLTTYPQEDSGDSRQIVALFQALNPDDLERLIFLLNIPIKERPPSGLSIKQREDHILRNVDDRKRLESELRYLVQKHKEDQKELSAKLVDLAVQDTLRFEAKAPAKHRAARLVGICFSAVLLAVVLQILYYKSKAPKFSNPVLTNANAVDPKNEYSNVNAAVQRSTPPPDGRNVRSLSKGHIAPDGTPAPDPTVTRKTSPASGLTWPSEEEVKLELQLLTKQGDRIKSVKLGTVNCPTATRCQRSASVVVADSKDINRTQDWTLTFLPKTSRWVLVAYQ